LSRLVEARAEIVKLAREWRAWVRRIARAGEEILGECEVYVFGSVAEGRAVGGSDVDVLIVSRNASRMNRGMWEVLAKIEVLAGLPYYHPYQIHLVTPDEAEWYFRHAKKMLRVRKRAGA